MKRSIAGFLWDQGNWPKCGKHGVSNAEIEHALTNRPRVLADRTGGIEVRFNAVGLNQAGRHVFVVFMFRKSGTSELIRPISARYMHAKEVDAYERTAGAQQFSDFRDG